jgi:hypothetical protein
VRTHHDQHIVILIGLGSLLSRLMEQAYRLEQHNRQDKVNLCMETLRVFGLNRAALNSEAMRKT